jgi:hypothetical protein
MAEGYLVKHRFDDGEGGYCALGALDLSIKDSWTVTQDATTALYEASQELFPERGSTVIRVSDNPATIKEDVLVIYDRAIEILKEQDAS